MDPNNTSPSYLLGRLMAVAERMQAAALGPEVNATVVDKLFGAASATPNAVFTRLMKGFRHHARKARDGEYARLAVKLEKQADEILHLLPVERNAFPPFLPLEQQGLFILGYHHQRYELFHPKQSEKGADRGTAAVPELEPPTEDQGDSEP
jgi:CRISPR-associated protein Csd1